MTTVRPFDVNVLNNAIETDVTANGSRREVTFRISAGSIGEIVFMYPRSVLSARGHVQHSHMMFMLKKDI